MNAVLELDGRDPRSDDADRLDNIHAVLLHRWCNQAANAINLAILGVRDRVEKLVVLGVPIWCLFPPAWILSEEPEFARSDHQDAKLRLGVRILNHAFFALVRIRDA